MPTTPPPSDTLARLRRRYGVVLAHVELARRQADVPLSEQHIWHLLAHHLSPQWAKAYQELQTAQARMTRFYSHENKPLGAIGAALDGVYSTETEDRYLQAQSRFTMIDERLRAKPFLGLLLKDILAQQKDVELSLGISSGVLRVTLETALASSAIAPSLSARFGDLARKVAVQFICVNPRTLGLKN